MTLRPSFRSRHWLLGGAVVAGLLALAQIDPGRPAASAAGDVPRVALFINGTLGDRSFFDSAARGLKQAQRANRLEARTIEGGADPTRWEPALADVADSGDFDLVIAGSFTMVPIVEKLAAAYPRMRFIVFDASVDYARCPCGNVHSILFRQNEGAYLAGYLAARLANAPLDGKGRGGLGVVGGMQIPVIDDFIVGFTAGARAAEPSVAVTRQYVNSFSDPATAKEISKALFGQGAVVVFQAAGGSGQGVIEAAAEAGRYAIGVDSDQYALIKAAHPEKARAILTSVLKNVDVALAGALARHASGALPYGRAESLGIAERGVSLAAGSEAMSRLPPDWLVQLAAVQQDLVSGRVRAPSAFAAAYR